MIMTTPQSSSSKTRATKEKKQKRPIVPLGAPPSPSTGTAQAEHDFDIEALEVEAATQGDVLHGGTVAAKAAEGPGPVPTAVH
jgi:hypothetical protein